MAYTCASPLQHVVADQAATNEWLHDLVRDQLSAIVDLVPPTAADSRCLFADIGDYIIRCSSILSQLAGSLINGPHIKIYVKTIMDGMEEDTGFSELHLIEYMNSKHMSLQKLASDLRRASESADSYWRRTRKPPRLDNTFGKRPVVSNVALHTKTQAPMESTTDESEGVASPSTQPHVERHKDPVDAIDSPTSDDPMQEIIQECLAKLSSRGKGAHICPFGASCTKGGVAPGGYLVKFERNSAFKSHLQKHEKAYQCNLPGCKNRSGFARYDQLRRHKQTVPHNT